MWIKYPIALACLVAPVLAATTSAAGQADLPAPTQTRPVTGAATARPDSPSPPTLVGVRHARHDRYDRIVFDFTGGTPAYRVEYGPLVGIGTGDPIPLAGPADLRIVFDGLALGPAASGPRSAATRTDVAGSQGRSDRREPASSAPPEYDLRRVLDTRYPTLRQVRFGGAFEGRMLAGLGLADRVGFRVLRLANPPRIAVDVAHQPTQPFGTATFWGGGGADVVNVAGVRTGRHPGYDRYVFDLRTAQHPLVSVAYQRLHPDRIHIGLTGMTPAGAVVSGPRPSNVSFNVYENGTVSAFVDTKRRTGFRVLLLQHPTRLVVDIAH